MTQCEVDLFLFGIKQNTFRCQVCGDIVFPNAEAVGNGVRFEKKANSYVKNCGQVVKDVCDDCMRYYGYDRRSNAAYYRSRF